MVGKALTFKGMERIVRHMVSVLMLTVLAVYLRVCRYQGELDKPWNCPHGRPTMRHLTDLSQIWQYFPDNGGNDGLKWEGESWADTRLMCDSPIEGAVSDIL
jgi:DNA mismatch repair protein PMS2